MEERSLIQIANGGDDEAGDRRANRDARPPGSEERRRGDRRAARGRRQVDKDFTCFSAPFIAHCLNQFGAKTPRTRGEARPGAAQAYSTARRRPGLRTPPA